MSSPSSSLVTQVRTGLFSLGYRNDLLIPDYSFALYTDDESSVEKIEIAAFARQPPSIRTACIGVTFATSENISKYASLGAPAIISLDNYANSADFWKFNNKGEPEIVASLNGDNLADYISKNTELSPESILRAKSLGSFHKSDQADLFDFGFVATIEKRIQEKLSELLGNTVDRIIKSSSDSRISPLNQDYKGIFRLLFRLIAAKLLNDRGYPGKWDDEDVNVVLKRIEAFYFIDGNPDPIIDSQIAKEVAWSEIRNGFHLENVSLETLAYVYENTFVDRKTRMHYSTHATPPEVAEYMVENLPFEDISADNRIVFEPFCGHAPFLVSAFVKLSSLLSSEISSDERHSYMSSHLKGMELDSFAIEVARYSLILADYPNPSGWKIEQGDFFESEHTTKYLEESTIVIFNPPYSSFSEKKGHEEREAKGSMGFEALNIILDYRPEYLGCILPRSFLTNPQLKDLRKKLISKYSNIKLLVLPDKVFEHAELETVVILAFGDEVVVERIVTCSHVSADNYDEFIYHRKPDWEFAKTYPSKEAVRLWVNPILEEISRHVAPLRTLGEFTTIRRGVEYNNIATAFSEDLIPGYVPGIRYMDKNYQPFQIGGTSFLSTDFDSMRRGKNISIEEWEIHPKVIVNANGKSRGMWRMVAAIDYDGLMCYQNMTALWPKANLSVYIIAAILNNPLANTIMSFNHSKGWHNPKSAIAQIPVPEIDSYYAEKIDLAVEKYIESLEHNIPKHDYVIFERRRKLLLEIDILVLKAYAFPIAIENEILSMFIEPRKIGGLTSEKDRDEIRSHTIDKYFLNGLTVFEARSLNFIDHLDDIALDEVYNPIISAIEKDDVAFFNDLIAKKEL